MGLRGPVRQMSFTQGELKRLHSVMRTTIADNIGVIDAALSRAAKRLTLRQKWNLIFTAMRPNRLG